MMRRAPLRFAGPKANPFDSILKKSASGKYYDVASLNGYSTLPFSIRVLLEAAVRNCDEFAVTSKTVNDILNWKENYSKQIEIPFKPARVILQDLTGVPCVVDLAAMRDAMKALSGDPKLINPQIPVDLVIDHSVQVDSAGSPKSLGENEQLEMFRNHERFGFLKWGSKAFQNFFIVPPGGGIVHQINLEFLARVVFENNGLLYPDTVVGTDSHTTMINGLGVLGWGVGGIEAEAAMLGQPMTMILPPVVGFNLHGRLPDGVTATDLVLVITQRLRRHGVVGKFVEFVGDGLKSLSLADRATIANMAPEYGATCGFFPIDGESLSYLRLTRSDDAARRVEAYTKDAGLFHTLESAKSTSYTEIIDLDLSSVRPSVSGPKRPHDRVLVADLKKDFAACMTAPSGFKGFGVPEERRDKVVKCKTEKGAEVELRHGSVVVAAITSCTNTSNPGVMVAAALVAKRAAEKGLTVSPMVKTSFSPGSRVVSKYLETAELQQYFDKLGFYVTGYGCMTCIGNSGDIDPNIQSAIMDNGLVASAVLSGNRNFEARIHPATQACYLASPPLVVAYALAGRVDIDFENEPIAGNVYLKDIWPTNDEVNAIIASCISREAFTETYRNITERNTAWNELQAPTRELYEWNPTSTYIHQPPYFAGMQREPQPIQPLEHCRPLAVFGDSITTDHISPAGRIAKTSPAARFLMERNVAPVDFNTYGSRRGNDEIMMRGTFANQRLSNRLVGEGVTGPVTKHIPSNEVMSIFDAAERYKAEKTPLIIFAGKEYGSGSSRDWAAKGSRLLGVRAVIAESFERIHRSNLVGMGVLPLQFAPGESFATLKLNATDTFSLNFPNGVKPQDSLQVSVYRDGKLATSFLTTLRIDTWVEVEYYQNGGILPYVLRSKLLTN